MEAVQNFTLIYTCCICWLAVIALLASAARKALTMQKINNRMNSPRISDELTEQDIRRSLDAQKFCIGIIIAIIVLIIITYIAQ